MNAVAPCVLNGNFTIRSPYGGLCILVIRSTGKETPMAVPDYLRETTASALLVLRTKYGVRTSLSSLAATLSRPSPTSLVDPAANDARKRSTEHCLTTTTWRLLGH